MSYFNFLLVWVPFWVTVVGVLLTIYQLAFLTSSKEILIEIFYFRQTERRLAKILYISYRIPAYIFGRKLLSARSFLVSVLISGCIFLSAYGAALLTTPNLSGSYGDPLRFEQGPQMVIPEALLQRGQQLRVRNSFASLSAFGTASCVVLCFLAEFLFLTKSRFFLSKLKYQGSALSVISILVADVMSTVAMAICIFSLTATTATFLVAFDAFYSDYGVAESLCGLGVQLGAQITPGLPEIQYPRVPLDSLCIEFSPSRLAFISFNYPMIFAKSVIHSFDLNFWGIEELIADEVKSGFSNFETFVVMTPFVILTPISKNAVSDYSYALVHMMGRSSLYISVYAVIAKLPLSVMLIGSLITTIWTVLLATSVWVVRLACIFTNTSRWAVITFFEHPETIWRYLIIPSSIVGLVGIFVFPVVIAFYAWL